MGYQFQYQFYFWLMLAIPVFIFLFVWLLRWKKATKKKIGDASLIAALISNFSSRRFNAKFVLLSTAFAFGVLALTNLRKPGDSSVLMRKGIDVMITLDVSRSMLAVDVQPNRLERAKQMILKLMDQMPNDRIGLVLFAGRAYLQMPLTVDHDAAKLFVTSASPDAVPMQGTVIGDALQMADNAFNPKERRFKSIILISDGEDHDENAMKKAEELAGKGVMINTVGIGSPEGAQIIDPATGEAKKDAMGNVVISKLNEAELQQISDKTNGIYIHLDNSDDAVNALMKQLSQIDKKSFGDLSLVNFKSYYIWFAGAMFLLLLMELFIPERKKKTE